MKLHQHETLWSKKGSHISQLYFQEAQLHSVQKNKESLHKECAEGYDKYFYSCASHMIEENLFKIFIIELHITL